MKHLIAAICIFLSFHVSAQDGLVGYWNFDQVNSGIVRDQSSYSNNAVTYGADQSEGVKGAGMSFNGVDSYMKITGNDGSPPSFLSELGVGTISIWFKVDHIPLDHGIAPLLYYGSTAKCDFFDAANQGLIIELGHSPIFPGSEEIFYTVWGNGCTYPSFCFDSGFDITKNEWHHFVVVVGENYNTGYLDGEELVDRDYNFGGPGDSEFFEDAIADQEFWLGKGHWDRTEQYFDGTIDELKIFNKPLTKEEVKVLYNEVMATSTQGMDPLKQGTIVYPNPAKNKLNIDISQINFKADYINLTDVTGKHIITVHVDETNTQLQLETIPEGMYSVNVIGKNSSVHQKIFITK